MVECAHFLAAQRRVHRAGVEELDLPALPIHPQHEGDVRSALVVLLGEDEEAARPEGEPGLRFEIQQDLGLLQLVVRGDVIRVAHHLRIGLRRLSLFRLEKHVLAFVGVLFGNAKNCKIVRFSGAACENDLVRASFN